MKDYVFPPGVYYVGDLCYVMTEDNGWDWHAVLDATGCLGLEGDDGRFVQRIERPAVFTYNGATFFSSSTLYGDGLYPDNFGREYGVDAGIIGCIEVGALREGFDPRGGHVVTFDQPFRCAPCDEDGRIVIGGVVINTGGCDEDDYGDDDCDEDGYDEDGEA